MSVWPLELVRAFSQNRAAVFVGAGVSRASGLPDWKSLIEPLKQEIDDCPDDATTLDIAQYFINDNRQRLLAERLSEQLNRADVQPSEIHRLLVRLPLDRIYTTNFDDLLERAYEQEKRGRVRRITRASNLSLDSSKLNVVKLHGDIEDPETIVITAEDFEDYFDAHSALAQQLSADLLQRTILFVGYSFTDPDMRAIMRRVSRDTGKFSRNHFIIQINPKKPVITELKRRGLICIELDGKPTASQCVLEWFQRLEERLTKEAPQASATAKPTNNNLPPPPPDLVGRTDDISATLSALESNRIVAVTGANGIGKTSVALAVAHEFAERKRSHFDYVVWVTARDGTRPFVALNEVLNAIGVTLEFPKIAQTPTSEIDKKRDQVNFLLQNRKTLVVLDNFELMADNQLIQWVRSVPAPSRVLITSAKEHSELGPDMTNHPLKGLAADHALSLLQHFLKDFDLTDAARATEPALRRIIEVTCGNPQAMRLALGVLQSDRFRFDDVIAKLDQQKNNVDRMFQQLFEWSWGMLPFAAEQLLIVTALFPGAGSIRRDAIETSTGLKRDEFEGALNEVLRFRLLNHAGDGRYVIHPRTRQFALAKVPNWGKFADEARE
ncbi:MAG TPA: SIR2 family protein, partial [Bryobacteraceae bacterium]|nr:SIR2 family protein [Bryobacteraceae bacterium]